MLNKAIKGRIGFGGVKLSVMPSLKSALTILETAFDNGITYFDTAPLYGSGYSEKIIGKFASNKRDKITIASKVGLNPATEYKLSPALALPLNYFKRILKNKTVADSISANPAIVQYRLLTKAYIKASFEKSLQNLSTDYIDNYLIHEALPTFLDDEALKYMMDLRAKKLVHNIGIATAGINFSGGYGNYENWDILQYEYDNKESKIIYENYSGKKHILHSVLSNAYKQNMKPKNPGYLIAHCLKTTHAKQILFSTSNRKHLLENIKSINSNYEFGVLLNA